MANIVELEDGSIVRNGVVETDELGRVTRVFSLDDMRCESASTVYVGERLKIKNNSSFASYNKLCKSDIV